MVGVVGVQVMGGVASDVVPVRLQKAELRVVQDVEVSAAQSVTGRSDQKVPVMFPRLPPHGEVERGATQLQPRRQQRVTEDLKHTVRGVCGGLRFQQSVLLLSVCVSPVVQCEKTEQCCTRKENLNLK